MADTRAGNTGGDGRGALYAMVVIVIALIIIAMILFMPRGGDDGTRDIDADIRIEAPERPAPGGDGQPDG